MQKHKEEIDEEPVSETDASSKKTSKRKISSKQGQLVAALIILAGAIIVSVYFYMQYAHSQELLKNPSLKNQEEAQQLLDHIGAIMDLPTGESPTIATVSDVTKLNSQPFFAHAQNGDKVIIYAKAGKAILFDPTRNKIVNVGAINATNQETQASAQPQSITVSPQMSPTPIRVALLNGTKINGFTKTAEASLSGKISQLTVVDRENASVQTYKKTTVVDLSGKNQQTAAQIAKLLNGEVGSLPIGEKKLTNADIEVILGSSKQVINSPVVLDNIVHLWYSL